MFVYIFLLFLIPISLRIALPSYTNGRVTTIKYKHLTFLLLAFGISVFLKGWAYNTGADFMSYYGYIKTGDSAHTSEFEIGFQWLASLFRDSIFPVQTFFVVAAFFYYYGTFRIAKVYNYAAPTILFFWSLLFFNLSCNLYRQYLAMSFFLIASSFYMSKKYIPSVIWALIAFSFHYSSIIVIPFFLLCKYLSRLRIKYWMVCVPIILSSFAGFVFVDAIEAVYNIYAPLLYFFLGSHVYDLSELLDDKYQTSYALVLSFFFLIWSYFGLKLKEKDPKLGPIYYMSVIYFILYPLFQQEIMARLLLYFQMFVPILYGTVFYHYFCEFKRKRSTVPFLFLLASVSIYSILFVHSLISLLENFPYRLNF